MSQNVFEYCSAIHIHSSYSDGSGSVPDILQAARKAGLDFIVLTDHNTLKARAEGWEGWHDDMLLVVGEEVSSRAGHCLALGTADRVNHRQPLQHIIQDIRAQHGLSFLAHPHGIYRPFLKIHDHSWKDWSTNGYTGLELWSYMFDWASEFQIHRFYQHYRNPGRRIKGPFAETLLVWDRLCQKTRCVALGGVDAHARRYPLLPVTVFPYETLFRTVRTHVLTPTPLSGTFEDDAARILEALRKGHCFVAYDLLYDATGTRFGSEDGVLLMGDEQPFSGPLQLEVRFPAEAEIAVLCDGQTLTTRRGAYWTFRAGAPGVYRVEARLNGKPWIYTNPIYLRAGA